MFVCPVIVTGLVGFRIVRSALPSASVWNLSDIGITCVVAIGEEYITLLLTIVQLSFLLHSRVLSQLTRMHHRSNHRHPAALLPRSCQPSEANSRSCLCPCCPRQNPSACAPSHLHLSLQLVHSSSLPHHHRSHHEP